LWMPKTRTSLTSLIRSSSSRGWKGQFDQWVRSCFIWLQLGWSTCTLCSIAGVGQLACLWSLAHFSFVSMQILPWGKTYFTSKRASLFPPFLSYSCRPCHCWRPGVYLHLLVLWLALWCRLVTLLRKLEGGQCEKSQKWPGWQVVRNWWSSCQLCHNLWLTCIHLARSEILCHLWGGIWLGILSWGDPLPWK
jgi:hypothetical protein